MSSFGNEKEEKPMAEKELLEIANDAALSVFGDSEGTTYKVDTGRAVIGGHEPLAVYVITDCTHHTLSGIVPAEYFVK